MADANHCERCHLPIQGERLTLWVEGEPPEMRSLELTLCENCIVSFRRWLLRQSRIVEAPEVRRGSARRRTRKSGVSPYSAALDQGETEIRMRTYATAAGIILAAFVLAGGVVLMLVHQ
jgi:hypothetical protein